MKNIAEQQKKVEGGTEEQNALGIPELKKRVQAILFAAGRAVSCEELCSLLGVATPGLVKEAVKELKEEINNQGSLVLIEEGTEQTAGWKLAVKDPYAELVKKITPHTEMDKALLETLAVIAWRHPALQSDVVKIRTSQAYEHIAHLVELGFIVREKKGNTFVLKPTQKFLDYFDLPSKEAVKALFKDIPAEIKEKYKGQLEQGQEEHPTPKKVGQLDVYTGETGEAQEAEFKPRSPEELGPLGLEVVDEPEEKSEEEKEEGDEHEESREEKPGERTESEEQREEIAEQKEEADDFEDEKDEEQPKKQKQEEPKRKLSKDLEDFANGS